MPIVIAFGKILCCWARVGNLIRHAERAPVGTKGSREAGKAAATSAFWQVVMQAGGLVWGGTRVQVNLFKLWQLS